MRKFRYVGPFDEVEVPALLLSVQRGHQIEVEDPDIADSLDAQDDWEHIPQKKAAKKAAPTEKAETGEGQPDTRPDNDDTKKEG